MNAVVWISKEAKRLQKANRNLSWEQARTKATAHYHSRSKKNAMPSRKKRKGPSKKKRTMPARRRSRVSGSSGVMTKSRTHTDYNRNKVNITVGSINNHVKVAAEKLSHLIGIEEVKKFKAMGKRQKTKIQKKITAYKAKYRRLVC
jgi:hypothetical protein